MGANCPTDCKPENLQPVSCHFLQAYCSLCRFRNVRRLDITSLRDHSDEQLSVLPLLRRLESLAFSTDNISPNILSSLSGLTSLEVTGPLDDSFSFLSHVSALRRLHMSSEGKSEKRDLTALRSCPNLQARLCCLILNSTGGLLLLSHALDVANSDGDPAVGSIGNTEWAVNRWATQNRFIISLTSLTCLFFGAGAGAAWPV